MINKKTLLARRFRRNQTPSESKMWSILRNRRLDDCKFYRQFPIGPYITDFCCRSKRLIVEIDGGGHAQPNAVRGDKKRDEFLQKKGYRIVHIWSNEVMNNIEGVAEMIIDNIQER